MVIACFGETLWDILPCGIFLGGAPLNVAYHLSRQGVRALPLSAVGRDFLGDEALRRIAGWGIDVGCIARRADRPTGTVRATLDAAGIASYRIARGVAWDRIAKPRAGRRRHPPAAIVHGTLALRDAPNRRSLAQLFELWPAALRVLDLNLRPPFDCGLPVRRALERAQFVKLNDEELGRLMGARPRKPPALERAARRFCKAHDLSRLCVTAGAQGAGLLWNDRWFWEEGRPTAVRDTVGAGDAFLATLLAGLLAHGLAPAHALANACRVGEFVAARDGATPPYTCDARGRPRDSA